MKDYNLKGLFQDLFPDYEFMGTKVFVRDWVSKGKILFISKPISHSDLSEQGEKTMRKICHRDQQTKI